MKKGNGVNFFYEILNCKEFPTIAPKTADSKKSFVCSQSQTSSLADMEACLNDDGGVSDWSQSQLRNSSISRLELSELV